MDKIPNFWDKTHPLSKKGDDLFMQLVEVSGNSPTLQGELLRASSKIGYDWYNNGWSCNNWSGAVVFLREHIGDLPIADQDEAEKAAFFSALREVHQYSHGEPVDINDSHGSQLVTTIHEYVVKKILLNPNLIPNELDMWDYSEPDYRHEEDEEEDDDWYDEYHDDDLFSDDSDDYRVNDKDF